MFRGFGNHASWVVGVGVWVCISGRVGPEGDQKDDLLNLFRLVLVHGGKRYPKINKDMKMEKNVNANNVNRKPNLIV